MRRTCPAIRNEQDAIIPGGKLWAVIRHSNGRTTRRSDVEHAIGDARQVVIARCYQLIAHNIIGLTRVAGAHRQWHVHSAEDHA